MNWEYYQSLAAKELQEYESRVRARQWDSNRHGWSTIAEAKAQLTREGAERAEQIPQEQKRLEKDRQLLLLEDV